MTSKQDVIIGEATVMTVMNCIGYTNVIYTDLGLTLLADAVAGKDNQ
jgi:hypothetical protein